MWDSFAEADLLAGDTAAAVHFYRKSVELNARNENGAGIVRRLSQSKE
jgi:hypothetical protein